MKILYLADYFFPFAHGGAETSMLEMAKALVRRKQSVFVLTPNYGGLVDEVMDGIVIHRYPFPRKLSSYSSELTIGWHFNPVYWLTLAQEVIKITRKYNIGVIHCQSATTVISGAVAGKLLRVPIVITFRDNQILCNYGLCLTINQFGKTCSVIDYFNRDFRHYYQSSVENKSIGNLFSQIVYACLGRIRVKALQYFARRCQARIVSSSAQRRTYLANGFSDTRVIHNIFPFPPALDGRGLVNKTILYATKLSPGKGLDLLLRSFQEVLKQFPSVKLQVIGGGNIKKYTAMARVLGIEKSIKFSGVLPRSAVMGLRKQSLLEVAPSIYPESFGRSALEALAGGLPVVASNRGGLVDIIDDGKTGFVVEPTVENISEAIIKAVKENSVLRRNIKKDYFNLKRKFETIPIEQHIALYRNLV